MGGCPPPEGAGGFAAEVLYGWQQGMQEGGVAVTAGSRPRREEYAARRSAAGLPRAGLTGVSAQRRATYAGTVAAVNVHKHETSRRPTLPDRIRDGSAWPAQSASALFLSDSVDFPCHSRSAAFRTLNVAAIGRWSEGCHAFGRVSPPSRTRRSCSESSTFTTITIREFHAGPTR